MGIIADRGAHREEDEGKERVHGPRVAGAMVGQPERPGLRYILNGVSFETGPRWGLKAQNYDKGFDRFIRKFDPDTETQAIVAIVTGFHADRGTAV
jgi:hypothetical protein